MCRAGPEGAVNLPCRDQQDKSQTVTVTEPTDPVAEDPATKDV
jgi:uncharacterized protein (DUF2336 family)